MERPNPTFEAEVGRLLSNVHADTEIFSPRIGAIPPSVAIANARRSHALKAIATTGKCPPEREAKRAHGEDYAIIRAWSGEDEIWIKVAGLSRPLTDDEVDALTITLSGERSKRGPRPPYRGEI